MSAAGNGAAARGLTAGALGLAVLIAAGLQAPARADDLGPLRVALKPPERAPYVPTAVRGEPGPVAFTIANMGFRSAWIGRLEVSYSASREGVAFPCGAAPTTPEGERQPSWLGPGASLTFERRIDCVLSLPGEYSITARLRTASEDGRAGLSFVRSFPLLIEGGRTVPRPYPGRPGLFVLITANRETEPWAAGDWASAYRVVIAIINGGARAVAAGHAQARFAVYKHGSPLACSGEAEPIVYPDYVMPGAVVTIRTPLSCAPAEAGHYDVVGRLQFDGSAEDVEAGRFGLQVAHDPLRYTPIPDPLLYPLPLRP